MASKHVFEADVLRAVAIMIIIFHHAYDFFYHETIASTLIGSVNEFLGNIGLGVFFFISGYLLYHHHPKIASRRDIIHFYKKRILRLYPLYLAALIVSLFCFGYLHLSMFNSIELGVDQVIVFFLGMQSLTDLSFMNYWFVSVILVYYFLYPIIVGVSKKTGDIALISLCIAAVALFVYVVSRNIDYRIFYFFMVFASGIIARRVEVFEQGKIEKYIPLLLVFVLSALAVEALILNRDNFVVGRYIKNVIQLASAASYNIIMISLCLLFFWMVSKYGSLGWSEKLYLPQISFGSYAAYLFDMICFATVYEFVQFFSIGGDMLNTITLVVGFPMVLVVGFIVQKMENKVKQLLNSRMLYGPRRTGGV
jgi:peptidoglycan/LPS O-acetylase OafA/YrhL